MEDGYVDSKRKFAPQVDSELLDSVRKLAKSKGQQIQAVVEDALREHLETKIELRA